MRASYLATFKDWRKHLGPAERATVMVVAADRRQARVIMRYCVGLLEAAPMLRQLITNKTRESLDLSNRVTIEVHTASFKTTRGYSLVAALCDEIAFWPTDEFSAEPDKEILAALRPGMANIPGSMLLCASSPYARKGELWNAHRRHYGKDDSPILVWQAPTRVMNRRIPQRLIDEAMEADPCSAQAEYGAQFRTDVESFVMRKAVDACVTPSVVERPPEAGPRYFGFCDPSGGSADEMTRNQEIFYPSEQATLIQDQAPKRNVDSKSIRPDSIVAHFYSQAAPRRLLQQNRHIPSVLVAYPVSPVLGCSERTRSLDGGAARDAIGLVKAAYSGRRPSQHGRSRGKLTPVKLTEGRYC
jgi:hypothetical protein